MIVLALAAWIVPLPLQVAQPGRVVPAGPEVEVTISQQFATDAGLRPEPVQGQFLAIRQAARPSVVRMLTSAMSSTHDVVPERSVAPRELSRPEVIAAVLGLGLSPARLEGTELPVSVEVGAGLDPASVGVGLLLFDSTSAVDVARGRRILGLGAVAADQRLSCPTEVVPSVAAAEAAQVDVVVVPFACAQEVTARGESDGELTIIVAETFVEAVEALIAE